MIILENLFNTFILLIIFLTPLATATTQRGYEEIKVILFLNLFVPLSILTILRIYFRDLKFKIAKLHWFIFLFILWLGLTSLFGASQMRSFFGVDPYFQGFIVFLFLGLFSFAVSLSNLTEKKISWTLIVCASVVAVIAILQTVMLLTGSQIVTYASRVISTFGQPNFFAGFILLTTPFWFHLWSSHSTKKERNLLLVLLLTQISAIALSQSRTAVFLIGVMLSIYFIHRFLTSNVLKIIILIVAGLILVFGLHNSGVLYAEVYRPLTVDYNSEVGGNTQHRLYFYHAALDLASRSPIFGFGLENIDYAIPQIFDFTYQKPPYYKELKDMTISRTHNLFLDLTLWGGVVALILFLLILFFTFKSAHQYQKLFLVIFVFWSTFQNLSFVHLLVFFLVLALASKQSLDTKTAKRLR